ncbi:SGNH/GDSL hydrolase family protein [Nonomuraea dietziae]|uniref:Lysophospholipase L1-like esterase n=1 Tax=Nonomuraea dietziae TaxID=65515 RepID=A0A7W5VCH9_9ACTN|nr:GDSL-type esterase/lipase family protein [Nonomuraea dietziae]MBB3729568.1 lysophospholipase L1-like esterase [Nonomuraea dietziae]
MLGLLLAAALGAVGTVGYLTFLRPADNPPADACSEGAKPGTRPIVVAAGASMTQGALGADWIGTLRTRPQHQGYDLVNAGVNGNTTADLRRRIDTDVVACRPAAVTLLIGTNDVRNGVPLEQYRDNLRAIVDRVKTRTTAHIALMSLPPLGENLDAEINRSLRGYNAAIKEIATSAGVAYLPVHEQMVEVLRRGRGNRPDYAFSFVHAFASAAQHYLLGRSWDQVAHSGGMELFVDHIHLSDRGGTIVADLASTWLSSLQGGQGARRMADLDAVRSTD